ncbi:MAG TPA: hypothetical protein VI318_06250 [Baekduia sp.]
MGRNIAGAATAAPVTHGRRADLRAIAATGAVLALLLLAVLASSAMATTGHKLDGQIGTPNSSGAGGISSGGPSAVAVRQSNGDVFVADSGRSDPVTFDSAPRIERFDAIGGFESSFDIDSSLYFFPTSLAIDPAGAASLYVGVVDKTAPDPTFNGAVLKYTAAGVFDYALDATGSGTGFAYPISVAVDPGNGDVFVNAIDSTTFAPVIDVFDDTGTFQTSFNGSAGSTDGAIGGIGSLAVDASHRLYVSDNVKNRVDRYDATGTWQATVDDGGARSVSVGAVTADPTSSQVYVVENGAQVAWFSAGGAAPLETFGAGHIGSAAAVAVNHASGAVYTADNTNTVVELFSTFTGPTIVTTSAASIDPTTETLNGTIDPGGTAASYHFEYGLDTSYGSATAETSAGSGNAAAVVSDTAAGLTPNTQYHVRLVGTNAGGRIYGNDQMFTTAAAAPSVDGSPPVATAITATGATLNGTVNPKGSDTTVHFDYRPVGGSTYTSTTDEIIPAAQGDTPLTPVTLTTLTAGTAYEFHVVADNGVGGTVTGANQSFTTAPGAPAGAASVTGDTAVLSGTVNPHGGAATYHFEYGLTASYGSATAEASAGSGNGDDTVTSPIKGLTPGTTYHVRVVASDSGTGVTTAGVDGTFATDPAPAALTGASTGVTTDHATLNGTADTHGLGGTYQFLVDSTTSSYQFASTPQALGAGGGPASVSASVADLPPGGDYRVRLAVTSSGVQTVGDEVTFSTAPVPVVIPPPTTIRSASYGCTAPALTPYNTHPQPGDTIKIAGTDLGVGGTAMLGTTSLPASDWSAGGFSITLPDDATGTLGLTVNCGAVSNTIAIAMYKAPSNSFTARAKTKGRTATVSVKVPGPGSISVRGGNVKTATKHAKKASTNSVKVTLTSAAAKSLKKHHKLAVTLTVRFTPTGGSTATKTVKVTFRR